MLIDKKKINLRIILAFLFVMINCASAQAASVKRDVKEGNEYYQEGEYQLSREKYMEALEKDPESDIVNFNLGTAYYKEEEYDDAVEHLQKVLLSEDETLKKNAHYNLGNALYQSGMMKAGEDIEFAVSSLEKALGQYERSLAMDAEDEDAKHNYDFVKKELIRLKEIQQQQKTCPLPKDKKDQEKKDESSEQQQQEGQQVEQQEQPQQKQQEGEEGERQEQQQQQGEGEEEKQQAGQQDGSQEERKKQEQGRGQEGDEDYNKKQEAGMQAQDARELTQREAQMLLENYQQAEEPQGLLKVFQKRGNSRPVLKDW